MTSKKISILFLILAIIYLVFTIYFRSPYPQDHFFIIYGEPIKIDSLTLIESYTINERDSHGSSPYFFDRPRIPNSTLDTNWFYIFASNLDNNLLQSFYVRSVVLIDNLAKNYDSIPFAMTLLNQKYKDNKGKNLGWVMENETSIGEKYVRKRSRTRIVIRNYFSLDHFNTPYKNEISEIRKLFNSKRISFVLETSIGRFVIRPRKYRVIDNNGKVVKESVTA